MHTFPVDNATLRKCEIPLGLVVCPLGSLSSLCGGGGGGGGEEDVSGNNNSSGEGRINGQSRSSSQWNGRELADIYNTDDGDQNNKELDYIPFITDNTPDPERVNVLRGPRRVEESKLQSDRTTQHHHMPTEKPRTTRAIAPPRCDRCQAYLNPFCTPGTSSSNTYSFRTAGTYTPIQCYNCNLCGAQNSISISDEYISNGTVDAALRCGTVEYEVGGAYCVRENPVENVHLYGVEYVPPECEGDANGNGYHHRHHGSMKSHGWREALDAIMEVAKGLRQTAPLIEDDNGQMVNAPVKIGVFAFCRDMLVFPYIKKNGKSDDEFEVSVAVVSDVEEDPFCPLPLHMWTHDVGAKHDPMEWQRFRHVMDSYSATMEVLLGDSVPSSRQELDDKWKRNCGGAALAALVDALKGSGGR